MGGPAAALAAAARALSPDGLSAERQRGLYAELWLLREHLLAALGRRRRSRGGRARAPPRTTSSSARGGRGQVHGRQAASGPADRERAAARRHRRAGRCYLFHLSLDVRQGEGETLVDAVAAVRAELAGTSAAAAFEERLLLSGYAAATSPATASTAYTEREDNFFHVGEGFPGSSRPTCPPGSATSATRSRSRSASTGASQRRGHGERSREQRMSDRTSSSSSRRTFGRTSSSRPRPRATRRCARRSSPGRCSRRSRRPARSRRARPATTATAGSRSAATGSTTTRPSTCSRRSTAARCRRRRSTKTEIDTALPAAAAVLGALPRRSDYHLELEESSDQFDMALRVAHRSPGAVERVRLFVLTDGVSRVEYLRPRRATATWRSSPPIWDIQRLHRCMTSGQRREPIEIDFVQRLRRADPLPAAPGARRATTARYSRSSPRRCSTRSTPQYGPRLLELNVRSFLQARGKVNRGIRDTHPQRARALPRLQQRDLGHRLARSSSPTLQRVDAASRGSADLQIVNGGQTTASIHHAVRRDKADVSRAFVQAKITVVPEERLDEIVPLISRYANSQNRVSEADLTRQRPVPRRASRSSRGPSGRRRPTARSARRAGSTSAPAASTPTRWRARERPRRQRAFKQQNPDPAEVREDRPRQVREHLGPAAARGQPRRAEELRASSCSGSRSAAASSPTRPTSSDLVAKAILFRRAERLVSAQEFGGYRANIVTYTLALLSNKTAQRIDLERIWERPGHRTERSPTRSWTSRHRVYEVITDPPGGGERDRVLQARGVLGADPRARRHAARGRERPSSTPLGAAERAAERASTPFNRRSAR